MSDLEALLAECLHIGLVLLAAPTLLGLCAWAEAVIAGRDGPPVLEPWHELARLLRKQRLVAESASAVTDVAPVAAVAALAVGACLVPSFALGMTLAPFADLLAVVGLLALARAALALAAMDAGTAGGGMSASRTMALGCLAEAALLMVAFVLALRAGSLNLDVITAMQQESGLGWPAGVSLAFAATLLIALIQPGSAAAEFGGPDLALVRIASGLRLLIWFGLIGALFLPFGMRAADAGPIGWLVGVACWAARLALFTLAFAVARGMLGRLSLRRSAQLLGLAVAVATVAALFLAAGMGVA